MLSQFAAFPCFQHQIIYFLLGDFIYFLFPPHLSLRRLCREYSRLFLRGNLLIHTSRTNVRPVHRLGVIDWIRETQMIWLFEQLERWTYWTWWTKKIKSSSQKTQKYLEISCIETVWPLLTLRELKKICSNISSMCALSLSLPLISIQLKSTT